MCVPNTLWDLPRYNPEDDLPEWASTSQTCFSAFFVLDYIGRIYRYTLVHLGTAGYSWVHLGTSGDTWVHRDTAGHTWVHLETAGSSWST